jgi:uncharacterized membrane protein
MIHFLQWYLIVVVVGLLAFPLSFRVLSRLPDRGWSISKPFGLLFVGYIFWILTTLQINQNSIGGILVGLVVLAASSVWQGFREGWEISGSGSNNIVDP